jgi:hypothetical protein
MHGTIVLNIAEPAPCVLTEHRLIAECHQACAYRAANANRQMPAAHATFPPTGTVRWQGCRKKEQGEPTSPGDTSHSHASYHSDDCTFISKATQLEQS